MAKYQSLIQSAICLVLLLCTASMYSQKQKKTRFMEFDTSQTYLVKLKDESSFTGKFIEKNDSMVIFTSKASRMEIRLNELESANAVEPGRFVNGKYWFVNPHHTRYLFSPSAFNLKAGEGYYQNIYATGQSVNYGFTDHFTLGAGTELISLFSGFPILVVTPKFGGYDLGKKWKAGGGAIALFSEEGGGGIGYGIVTQGTEDRNITFGLGWAFSTSGDIETKPVATISGMYRFSKNTAFVTENWLIPAGRYEPIVSYGIRFFGEKIAVDVAFINSVGIAREIIAIGIPYVDFVYKF
jgi:hypothetical protein